MSRENLVSIQSVVETTGLTSRTLRHYDDIGLLKPIKPGNGGMRYYGQSELEKLQAILIMRELGLPLGEIQKSLENPALTAEVLENHVRSLESKARQLDAMIRATKITLANSKKGKPTPMNEMFDGFDHTQYRDEVEERWGKDAYANSDKWWRSMSEAERAEWKTKQDSLITDWRSAAEREIEPASDEAQALAARQEAWLGSIPGTPGFGTGQVPAGYLLGLAEMYVSDERFGANYGGLKGAAFVKDAITHYVANRK